MHICLLDYFCISNRKNCFKKVGFFFSTLFYWQSDSPLPRLGDSQQVTHQLGVGWKDHLHSTFMQQLQGSVRPQRPSQQEGQTLRVDPSFAVRGAVGPAAPIHICGQLWVCHTAILLRELDQQLPLIQVMRFNTWKRVEWSEAQVSNSRLVGQIWPTVAF